MQSSTSDAKNDGTADLNNGKSRHLHTKLTTVYGIVMKSQQCRIRIMIDIKTNMKIWFGVQAKRKNKLASSRSNAKSTHLMTTKYVYTRDASDFWNSSAESADAKLRMRDKKFPVVHWI